MKKMTRIETIIAMILVIGMIPACASKDTVTSETVQTDTVISDVTDVPTETSVPEDETGTTETTEKISVPTEKTEATATGMTTASGKKETETVPSESPAKTPKTTEAPKETQKPTVTPKPTKAPKATEVPKSTPKPTATPAPAPTNYKEGDRVDFDDGSYAIVHIEDNGDVTFIFYEPEVTPGPTATPVPTATPTPTPTPEPTATPTPAGVWKCHYEIYMNCGQHECCGLETDAHWYETTISEYQGKKFTGTAIDDIGWEYDADPETIERVNQMIDEVVQQKMDEWGHPIGYAKRYIVTDTWFEPA